MTPHEHGPVAPRQAPPRDEQAPPPDEQAPPRDEQAPPRDEQAVARFVEQSAATLADMGFARMPARVLMLLMVTEEPGLTAADLAVGLQVSPAAVSNAVRYLMQVGLAEREAVQGARRDLYRLPNDTWYAASGAKQPAYRKLADVAGQGIKATGGRDTPAGARLSDMESFFDYLDTEIPGVVERWHQRRERTP
ncbi:MAG: MarR family transcriptional regulator [Actinomycetota bacterium]